MWENFIRNGEKQKQVIEQKQVSRKLYPSYKGTRIIMTMISKTNITSKN